jgi:hypothetical protein
VELVLDVMYRDDAGNDIVTWKFQPVAAGNLGA